MFKELGMLSSLLGNKAKIQDRMTQFHDDVGKLVATGTAGGGQVTVKVNGKFEVLAIVLTDDAHKLADKSKLEDLITNAVNAAMTAAKAKVAELTQAMANDLGLPPSMLGGGLPGIG